MKWKEFTLPLDSNASEHISNVMKPITDKFNNLIDGLTQNYFYIYINGYPSTVKSREEEISVEISLETNWLFHFHWQVSLAWINHQIIKVECKL